MEQYINKIIHADCMDILKQLPDKCIDLIITDAPYFGIVKDDWDNQWKDIFEFQKWVGEVGKELHRILKDNGSFYWFGDDKTIAYCQVELDKNFFLLNNLVWRKKFFYTMKGANSIFRSYAPITERCLFYDKSNSKYVQKLNPFAEYLKKEFEKAKVTNQEIAKLFPSKTGGLTGIVRNWFYGTNLPTKEQYLKIKEYLGSNYLSKEYENLIKEYEGSRRFWNNDIKAFDVLDYKICSEDKKLHPTQKPIDLISYLIERSSNNNDLILDCFSGSGTTAIACHNLNRRFICIEKDYDYWKASVERLENAKAQMKLF